MRLQQLTVSVALLMALTSSTHAAVTRYVAASGNWSSTNTWKDTSGGSAPATSIPNGTGDAAVMADSNSNRSITLDLNVVLGELSITNRKYLQVNTTSNTITFRTAAGNAVVSVTGNSNGGGVNGNELEINPNVILDLTGKTLNVTQSDRSDNTRTNRIAFRGAISGTGDISIVNNDNDNDNSSGGHTILSAINSIGAITANAAGGSGGGRILFQGALGANVTSLTKKGAGIAIMSGGINAYSSGTFIEAGILQVNAGTTLGESAALEISSGAVLSLLDTFQTVQGTISSLKLGGTPFTSVGTYGSTTSGATFQNDTYFSGTGVVQLIPEPASLALLAIGGVLMLPRRKRMDV